MINYKEKRYAEYMISCIKSAITAILATSLFIKIHNCQYIKNTAFTIKNPIEQ